MIKHVMILGCLLAVSGCASNTAGVAPARPAVETQQVQAPMETPKAEPIKADGSVPQKAAAVVEQPNVPMPTTLNFKRNVVFNHKSHSESFACIKCHKDKPGKIAGFGKDFAHEICKGCHKDNGQSTACSSCHRG